jgi:hypothetical protein
VPLTRKRWTQEEIDAITAMSHLPASKIAQLLHRTPSSIHQVRCRIANGVQRAHVTRPRILHRRPWTDEDRVYLNSNYGIIPVSRIAKALGRTVAAVQIMSRKLGVSRYAREEARDNTLCTWSSILGISHAALQALVARNVIPRSRADRRYGYVHVISAETIEDWLRAGHAVRCVITADTPVYWAELISEVTAQYISCHELAAIDPWLTPHHLKLVRGMDKTMRMEGITTGNNTTIERATYYRKVDVYNYIYNCAMDIPSNIKNPYVMAVRTAWHSVYMPRWEINAIVGKTKLTIPRPICYGVYNRGEVVEWLRAQKAFAHLAHKAVRTPVTWQSLHADLDRAARRETL